jgi:gamma-glutamyl-gamma-aminobutyrate hydrolase PuuD
MPKVYVIGNERAYVEMFLHFGWTIVSTPETADLIQFTGGEDVSPHLYGESVHPLTHHSLSRDDKEKAIFDKWHKKKKMAGICRGGQFLNVMCGGSMYQHHSGHPYIHKAWVYSNMTKVNVSSTHHQIMRPNKDTAIILMAANIGVIAERCEGEDIVQEYPDWETEALLYPDDGVLCFQPHPEFGLNAEMFEECMHLYFSFLEDLMNDVQQY